MTSKSRTSTGKSATYLQRGISNDISYEDVLLAQYMNEIPKTPPFQNERDVRLSPYAVSAQENSNPRLKRSKSGRQRHGSHGAVDGSHWGSTPQTITAWVDNTGWKPQEGRPKRMNRPVSAPAFRNRSGSFSSAASSNFSRNTSVYSSTGSAKKTKALYKKKPNLICVRAFQNGNRDNYARITVPDMQQLLDACTEKLGLVSAARKLFLSDGSPVTHPKQLSRDVDVYVSCGEAFRDPYASIQDREELRRSASWTISGIVFPEHRHKGRTRPSLSKRMQSLVETQKRRILVFRNGENSEGIEIVAGRFDEFLDDCTKKLNLESGARLLFDWQGREIKSFSDVPVLDRILQPSTSVILGPVWVTRGGERFSPKGAYHFITSLLLSTKERLKQSKAYKQQLELHVGGGEIVSKEIMAMSEVEVESELKEVEQHISDLSSVIPTLKSQLKVVEGATEQEEAAGLESFRYQHLANIAPQSRLLGKQGLRLKVFENGSASGRVVVHFNLGEAEKGIQGDKSQLLHRFLDTCTSCQRFIDGGSSPAGRRIAKRVFTRDGQEITDVHDLKYDQEIWLSYGQDFIPLHVLVLQLVLDKATCMSLWGEKEIVQKESLGEEGKGKENSSLWKAVKGFPSGTKRQLVSLLNPGSEISQAQSLQVMRVDETGCFLQCKENKNLVLYPELKVVEKNKKGDKGMWPPDAQTWVISQNGLIRSKAMPQLVLSRGERAFIVQHPDGPMEGLPVVISKRNPRDINQQWGFSPTGQIYCLSKPSLVLSYTCDHHVKYAASADDEKPAHTNDDAQRSNLTGTHFGSEGVNQQTQNKEREGAGLASLKDEFRGEIFHIVLLPKKQGDATQRWAIKQEDLHNLGQWKNSTISNPEWNKKALSWPVNEDGTWNSDFTWPMEGFLLPYAPSVKRPSQPKFGGVAGTPARLRVLKNGESDCSRAAIVVGPDLTNSWRKTVKLENDKGTPARLRVLKNGESDCSRAAIVVGPDLTNMLRDVSGGSPSSSKKQKRQSTANKHGHRGEEQGSQSCHPLDLKTLELDLFLDRCTDALGLPFAARRLFTADGNEVNSLSGLQRDELVYVSCGEAWSDPNLSHSEQQRRAVLANLASDILHIRHYCSLRDPADLVFQVDGPLSPGSHLIVASCCLASEERERLATGNSQEESPPDDENNYESVYDHALSAHERSHIRSEERLKTLQWPWETERTFKEHESIDEKEEDDFQGEVIFSDRQLHRKFRRQVLRSQEVKSADPSRKQCWYYSNDGFVSVKGTSLVLGLDDTFTEGKAEVILCKKKLEDFTQRWVIAEDGFISQRSNQHLVLTVTSPPLGNDPFSVDNTATQGFEGASVILAHRKPCANGNAHQLFRYDPITGFIEAFAADSTNKEITAANKSGVCTFALLGPQELPQPGYVHMSGTSNETYLCEACGKSSRGRHKLQRLHQFHTGFACALGTDQGLRLTGSFKCLNSKVDLSTLEAEATLDLWEHQLERLRNESSVRTITRELHMAQRVPAVRIRAFKNGDGSRGHGEIIIGSSIHSLLDQCTIRLGIPSAARRLYTCCGELITDIQQLIRPYSSGLITNQPADNTTSSEKMPEERLIHDGHAVDVVEAENRRFYKSKTKDPPAVKLEQREKELLVSEALEKLDMSHEEKDDDQSSGNLTYSVGGERTGRVPVIRQSKELATAKWDIRWPVDVWVSCGEPFVPLQESDKQYLLSMKHREERTWVQAYLDQEKHILRQMQGRRITGRNSPPSPRGTRLAPAWHEPTRAEEKKGETIGELKNHLDEVKSRQKHGKASLCKTARESTQRLYLTPKTVRVKAVPNGETKTRAVVVFGASIEEILDACTNRLDLSSAARRLFNMEGDEITHFSDIQRDQFVCVSSGEGFVRAADRHHRQELKATWSRLNRQSGGSVIPGIEPMTSRNSVTFDNAVLALPAPVSPPPPAHVTLSPSRQVSVHRVSNRH